MLRPKQMSRVSITGTKDVMEEFVSIIHGLNAIHLIEYDGSWDGFKRGDPGDMAEEVSEKLVTVRSIESILKIGVEYFDSKYKFDGKGEEKLEVLRERVNGLEDRRNFIRDRVRRISELLEEAESFADIGVDLDLLSGYGNFAVVVGTGDVEKIRDALSESPVEIFSGEKSLAIISEKSDENILNGLEGIGFEQVEIPENEKDISKYILELNGEKQKLTEELSDIQMSMGSMGNEAKKFLLASEEMLSIEVQKTEAPLSFATTENAFIAEGWIPTKILDELNKRLQKTIGDHMLVEEIERADYGDDGFVEDGGEIETGDIDIKMGISAPPVVQDNPTIVQPFEVLVQTIGRPKYSELDPTLIIFLTFPAFFGFMIGDLGYGICYAIIGYLLMKKSDSIGIKSLGGVAIWAGLFTMFFGIFYGEIFGLHVLGEVVWNGHPPIEKGLSPKTAHFALLWLVVAMLLGLLHVTIGHIFDFVNKMKRSLMDAVLESGSWIILMGGVWVWVFSKHARSAKPDLLFEQLAGEPLAFTGFSSEVGVLALGIAAIGLILMIIGEIKHQGALGAIIGILEAPNVLVNILSYARIPAVLLAKAGMAFVVNLLVFGAYIAEDGASHFMHSTAIAAVHGEIIFPGLIHPASFGFFGLIGGGIILILGHAIVLALGVTSAGLQSVRLEYVEFFQKFYAGGGVMYTPFGKDKRHTE